MMKIRIAGALIAAGLVVELGSIWWDHPLAFVVFFVVTGAAVAAGVLVYLYTLLWKREPAG